MPESAAHTSWPSEIALSVHIRVANPSVLPKNTILLSSVPCTDGSPDLVDWCLAFQSGFETLVVVVKLASLSGASRVRPFVVCYYLF